MRLDVANLRDAFRPNEQHGGLAVRHDEGDLGPGQPPVHRRHHDVGLDRAKQKLKIDVAVLAEIGNALAGLEAERFQPVGDPIGLDVKFGEAGPASLEFVDDGVAPGFGKSSGLMNRLKPGIIMCREKQDSTSAILLEKIVADEELHIDYLETQLELMEKLGEELYSAQCVSRPPS